MASIGWICGLGCGQYEEDSEFTTKRLFVLRKQLVIAPTLPVVAVDLLTEPPKTKQIDGQVVCSVKLARKRRWGTHMLITLITPTTIGVLFEQWLAWGASIALSLKDPCFNEYKNAGGGGNWELGCVFGISHI